MHVCVGLLGVPMRHKPKSKGLRTLPETWSQGLGLPSMVLSSSASNLPPVHSHVVEIVWDFSPSAVNSCLLQDICAYRIIL